MPVVPTIIDNHHKDTNPFPALLLEALCQNLGPTATIRRNVSAELNGISATIELLVNGEVKRKKTSCSLTAANARISAETGLLLSLFPECRSLQEVKEKLQTGSCPSMALDKDTVSKPIKSTSGHPNMDTPVQNSNQSKESTSKWELLRQYCACYSLRPLAKCTKNEVRGLCVWTTEVKLLWKGTEINRIATSTEKKASRDLAAEAVLLLLLPNGVSMSDLENVIRSKDKSTHSPQTKMETICIDEEEEDGPVSIPSSVHTSPPETHNLIPFQKANISSDEAPPGSNMQYLSRMLLRLFLLQSILNSCDFKKDASDDGVQIALSAHNINNSDPSLCSTHTAADLSQDTLCETPKAKRVKTQPLYYSPKNNPNLYQTSSDEPLIPFTLTTETYSHKTEPLQPLRKINNLSPIVINDEQETQHPVRNSQYYPHNTKSNKPNPKQNSEESEISKRVHREFLQVLRSPMEQSSEMTLEGLVLVARQGVKEAESIVSALLHELAYPTSEVSSILTWITTDAIITTVGSPYLDYFDTILPDVLPHLPKCTVTIPILQRWLQTDMFTKHSQIIIDYITCHT